MNFTDKECIIQLANQNYATYKLKLNTLFALMCTIFT